MILPASRLAGLGLAVAAAVVMAGWLLREPLIVEDVTGTAIVFDTALCFALAGIALGAGPSPRLRATLGTAVMLIAVLVLTEYLGVWDLGIDVPALHRWEAGGDPRPGRMAQATAAAFVLSGATLCLVDRVRGLWSGIAVQALTAAIALLGAFGIASRALRLELVYDDFPFRAMALHTGAGFFVLAGALWLHWRGMPWYRERGLIRREDERIALAGGTVLALVLCAYAIAAFALSQRRIEEAAREGLSAALGSRVDLFRTTLESRTARAVVIATRPSIVALVAALGRAPDDAAARSALQAEAESALPFGFSGLAFYGKHGVPLASAGRLTRNSAEELPIAGEARSALRWEHGVVLNDQIAIGGSAEPVGTMMVEQGLPTLTRALDAEHGFGAGAEIVVCGHVGAMLECMRQAAPSLFRLEYSPVLPIARGLEGRYGVAIGQDYRGHYAIAAHGPVGDTGLAMVVKMETAELYSPLRGQMLWGGVLLVFMVSGGAWLLRLSIRPLARRLASSEERLSLALDGSRLALWDYDVRARTIHLDARWREMLGGRAQASVTSAEQLLQLVHPDDLAPLGEHFADVLAGTASHYDIEHRVRRDDGEWLWIRSRGRVVARDAQERALRLAGTNADIDQRKRAEQELAHQAAHDALTGLPNRYLLRDRLARAIIRSRRSGALMAVLYLDIDKFKSINDSFGHDVGDALIVEFAGRLGRCIRDTDTAARLGGDEFAVILEALHDREAGCRIAEKIVVAMREPFRVGGQMLAASTSAGIAFGDGAREIDPERILKRADQALYAAKAAGRNTYRANEESAAGPI